MVKYIGWIIVVFFLFLMNVLGWGLWVSSREEIRERDQEIEKRGQMIERVMQQNRECSDQLVIMNQMMKLAKERLEEMSRERGRR